ncbi:MAG: DUF2251 domain-containing protein [Xanthomonadaceae bacterium]|nr:DUF2251 domain-containing protein [Xanthomonadaceae bacterium]
MPYTILPGFEALITSDSPSSAFSVTFEDDGETAYFYACDRARFENPILDAVHIYNASQLAGGGTHSAEITWSPDGLKAGLQLNGQLHALIDFSSRQAYCRTNFPPPVGAWAASARAPWHEQLSELLFSNSAGVS